LKANRPATFKNVEAYFDDPPPGSTETYTTTDGEHGRIETRRHAVCHDVAWLFSDRRYPGEVAVPSLAMIGMVESETEREGKTARERRYYLSSAKLDAETFAPVPSLAIGASRTGCIGFWTWSSRITSPACGPAMRPRTWQSSNPWL
jgi:hypothetical protein